jgi:hypothetical protein
MSRLYETTYPNGDTLIRMARPTLWGHMRWCAEPGCENLKPGGWIVPNRNVWGYQRYGESTMIGWRAACSRKHAISIWQRELTEG